MRQTLIFLIAIGILLSCNNADKSNASSDKITVKQGDTTEGKTDRQVLIEELKRLQAIFLSKDNQKIADIFEFPLSDTTVGIYIGDSTFNAQYEKNGNKATRAMFIRYSLEILESLQIDQINQLFKKINLDRLVQKDTLKKETIIKTEPCYHFYGVKVEKALVTLTVGTNSNKVYGSKSASEDEIPENSSEICEHVLWWVFRFDGKKLHLKNISGAG